MLASANMLAPKPPVKSSLVGVNPLSCEQMSGSSHRAYRRANLSGIERVHRPVCANERHLLVDDCPASRSRIGSALTATLPTVLPAKYSDRCFNYALPPAVGGPWRSSR